jgi:ribosomal protein L15
MKVKVLQEFRDKYTKEDYKVNDVITVSKERYAEILTKGNLVEEVVEPKKATKKATKKDAE